jgi:DNA-binding Lrp family transcriptional regulator|tara:strand:+ start:18 stop:296 length:279 start_codon:yes stop_codon:yes gene_type:complete
MASAFVVIKVENREVEKVYADLLALSEVTEAHVIDGIYEVFLLVSTETMSAIEELVQKQIEQIEGVISTLTLIILDPDSKSTSEEIPLATAI